MFIVLAAGVGSYDSTPATAQERSDMFCAQGLVIISELMAAPNPAPGSSSLRDQFGRIADWIELYNTGDTPVDLTGWRLTDDYDDLARWQFPAGVQLPGRSYLVVFASGENRMNPAQPLHTNFRLERAGEFLGVVNPAGEIVFSFGAAYPEQLTGVAYGYEPRRDCLTGYGLTPRSLFPASPRRRNPDGQGPLISAVAHEPDRLPAGQNLTVAATVAVDAPDAPVHEVTLHYRINFGREQTLPMRLQSGATYAATLPTGAAPAGALVRYYVTANLIDSSGQTHASRWPLPCERPVMGTTVAPAPPPVRPHAVWLPLLRMPADRGWDYVRCPEYTGTVVGAAAVESQTALPLFHWYIEEDPTSGWEWYRPGFNAHVVSGNPAWSYNDPGATAVLYYDGHLYDNVLVKLRGAGTLGFNKKGIQFEFNEDHDITVNVTVGDGKQRANEIHLATTGNDESFIRQPLGYAVYAQAGASSVTSFPVRLQQNGHFFGVFTYLEDIDRRFVERNGLYGEGLLYKSQQNTLTLPHYVPNLAPTDGFEQILPQRVYTVATLAELIRNINPDPFAAEPDYATITAYLFDHFDIPGLLNYMAARTVLDDFDTTRHNYLVYQDLHYDPAQPSPALWTGTGEWRILPWDKDNVLRGNSADDHPFYGAAGYTDTPNALFTAVVNSPVLQAMYLRRLRSVMDTVLADTGDGAWIDAYAAVLTAQVAPDARLDSAVWSHNTLAPTDARVSPFDPTVLPTLIESRRRTLYGPDPRAYHQLIPPAQAGAGGVVFGPVVTGDAPESSAVTLVNCTLAAMDLSGWSVAATEGEPYTLRAGVVLPAGGSVHLTPDVRAFRAYHRQQQGVANLGYFVLGGLDPALLLADAQADAAALTLFDATATAVAHSTDNANCNQVYLPVVQE